MYDAVLDAYVLMLITEWKEFRLPSWAVVKKTMNQQIVLDGRNIYDKKEMEELADAIIAGKDIRAIDNIRKHAEWVDEWYANYEITSDNIKEVLHIEIAKRFVQVLECAGVFKRTEKGMEQFKRFLSVL